MKKTPMQIRQKALEDSLKLVTKLAVRKTTAETEFPIVSSFESRAQEIADKYDAFVLEARQILGIKPGVTP